MVRFQKWIKNLRLTLHGHNVHRQRRQLSKFLMRYQQFTSHAYCVAAGPVSKMALQQEKVFCVRTCYTGSGMSLITVWMCVVWPRVHTLKDCNYQMRNLDSWRRWRCMLCPCKVRNTFFIHFWYRTILLCMPCIFRTGIMFFLRYRVVAYIAAFFRK
jgi:hypothetical protein